MKSRQELLDELSKEVSDTLGPGPGLPDRRAQRGEVMALVASRGHRPRTRLLLSAAATAILASVIVVVSVSLLHTQSMRFWIGEETVPAGEGSWFRTGAEESVPITFEDGSRLDTGGGVLGRVIRSNVKDVTIALAHGELQASVRSGGRTNWTFHAGLYRVAVVGTRFRISWNAGDHLLVVSVESGLVRVYGEDLGAGGVEVGPGQQLHVDKGRKTVSRTAEEPAEASPTQTQEESAEPIKESEPKREKSRKHRNRKVAAVSVPPRADPWREYYEQEQYERAVRAAEAQGLNDLIEKLDLTGLWQLSDAARYTRRSDVAKKVLAAVRRRFAVTRRARVAAFLLGKVAMELDRDPARAAKWFGTYLQEDPDGPLEEEALGRLIDAYLKSGRNEDAARAARTYLERYRKGIFSDLARSVTGSER